MQSWVFALSVSPSGKMLASLGISGQLCLWDLPSLRLRQQWVPDQLVRAQNELGFLLKGGFKVGNHGPLFEIMWVYLSGCECNCLLQGDALNISKKLVCRKYNSQYTLILSLAFSLMYMYGGIEVSNALDLSCQLSPVSRWEAINSLAEEQRKVSDMNMRCEYKGIIMYSVLVHYSGYMHM